MPTLPTFNPGGFTIQPVTTPTTGLLGTSGGVIGGAAGGFALPTTPTPVISGGGFRRMPVSFSPPPQPPLVKPPEPIRPLPVFSPPVRPLEPVRPLPLPVPLEPARPPPTDASFRKGEPLPELPVLPRVPVEPPKQTEQAPPAPPFEQPSPGAVDSKKGATTRPLPELKLPTPSGQVLTNDRVLTSSTVSAPISLPKNLTSAGDSQALLMSAIAAAGVGYFTYKEKGATLGAVLAGVAFLGVQKILSMK